MDTRFIGKPHEWDPRRVYSQTGADWQYRVDFDRLRKDRLQRLKEQMNARDLGALVLFAGANIRYVTASYQGNWKYNINIRYAVLPNGAEPVLFETADQTCTAPRLICPGWKAASIRLSHGNGRRARFQSWPAEWRRVSSMSWRPTECAKNELASTTSIGRR